MKCAAVPCLLIATCVVPIQVVVTLSLSRAEISAQHNASTSIPKILHRVFLPQKNGKGVCNAYHDMHITECRGVTSKNNPEWEEWVWGEQEIEALFIKHAAVFKAHPEIKDFPEVYKNFDGWMKRQDSIRHLILYLYGGLYMDEDVACKPIAHLLNNANFVLRKMGKTNFMACIPNQQLSINVLAGIVHTAQTGILPGETVKHNVSHEPDGSINPIQATGEKQICEAMTKMGYSIHAEGDVYAHYPSGNVSPDFIRVLPVEAVSNYREDGKYLTGSFSVDGGPVCIHRPLNAWAVERYRDLKAVKTSMEERKNNLHSECKAIYEHTLYGEPLMKKAHLLGEGIWAHL